MASRPRVLCTLPWLPPAATAALAANAEVCHMAPDRTRLMEVIQVCRAEGPDERRPVPAPVDDPFLLGHAQFLSTGEEIRPTAFRFNLSRDAAEGNTL